MTQRFVPIPNLEGMKFTLFWIFKIHMNWFINKISRIFQVATYQLSFRDFNSFKIKSIKPFLVVIYIVFGNFWSLYAHLRRKISKGWISWLKRISKNLKFSMKFTLHMNHSCLIIFLCIKLLIKWVKKVSFEMICNPVNGLSGQFYSIFLK